MLVTLRSAAVPPFAAWGDRDVSRTFLRRQVRRCIANVVPRALLLAPAATLVLRGIFWPAVGRTFDATLRVCVLGVLGSAAAATVD